MTATKVSAADVTPSDDTASFTTHSPVRTLTPVLALLVSVGLLMAGTGLGSSLLGLRAGQEGFTTAVTGIIMSAYYAGFLVGSLLAPRLIRQVGHIRVFSGLASLASVGVLVHVVLLNPFGWGVLRLVTGFCISGLFIVAETWMNGSATNQNRGQIMAAYMVVATGGQAIGQLLLNLGEPAGFSAFVLTSVLVSLAVVPVTLTSVRAPELLEGVPFSLRQLISVAPLGVLGSAVAGFTGAVMIGLGAVYASESGLSVGRTSLLLFATLGAAVVLQFPIGKLSDHVDRRWVIALASFVAGGCAMTAAELGGPDKFTMLLPMAAIAGGLSFPLYSMANAHVNDYLPPGTLVSAGALMVLVNGAGAVVGPIIGAVVIASNGPDAFFAMLAVAYIATGIYTLYRMTRRRAVDPAERASFVPLPAGVGPTSALLSPGAAEELYPQSAGSWERAGAELHWIERGVGDPVLLVHDAGSSAEIWSETMLVLADLGHRVIAVDLRGHGLSTHTRPYNFGAFLADLDVGLAAMGLAQASMVGMGAGGPIVGAYAAEHPTRVPALVLVSVDNIMATDAPAKSRLVTEAMDTAIPAPLAAKLGASAHYERRRSPQSHKRLTTDLRRSSRDAVSTLRREARRAADHGGLLQRIAVPVTVVRGDRNRGRIPDAVVIDEAGHFVANDRPEELAWVIHRHVRTFEGAATPDG